MKKQISELFKSKIFAFFIVAAVIVLSALFLTHSIDDSTTKRHYAFDSFVTVGEIDDEIELIEANLEELGNGREERGLRHYLERSLRVLKELKSAHGIMNLDRVFQGPGTDGEDSAVFLFKYLPFVTLLSLAAAVIIISVLITREFDNGSYIHVYTGKRYSEVLCRARVAVIITSVMFFLLYLFLFFAAKAYPKDYLNALLVDSRKAYFIDVSVYRLLYGFVRHFYIVLFGSICYISIAVWLKKTLPFVLVSVSLTAAVFAVRRLSAFMPALLGLANTNSMTLLPKLYYDLSLLFIAVPVLLLVLTLSRFEKQDL